MPLHECHGLGRERAAADRLGRRRHEVAGSQSAWVIRVLEGPAQVTVGDDAAELAPGAEHAGHAEALRGDLDERVLEGRVLGDERQGVAPVHQLLDACEPPPESAARMQQREVLGREAALLEERKRERVAERHGSRRAGGGREPEGAGLDRDAHVECHVGLTRERGVGVARDRHQRDAEAASDGKQPQHLLALPAVRDREEDVAPDERADVAMAAFAGVQEEGRRAGGGERRGDLAADDARLADARDDDLAAAGEEQVERARETGVEAVPDGGESVRLDVEDAPRPVEPLGGHQYP